MDMIIKTANGSEKTIKINIILLQKIGLSFVISTSTSVRLGRSS
jgi:hypothetical protein